MDVAIKEYKKVIDIEDINSFFDNINNAFKELTFNLSLKDPCINKVYGISFIE